MPISTVTSYAHPTVDSQTNLAGGKEVQPNYNVSPSELMKRLLKEKKIARDFQTRRHDDWNDTYDLYRGVNKTNRLTQRQAVNIPIMKETVKTLLSKIDDAPVVKWRELSGDQMKQLIFQEMWDEYYKDNNLEGVDIQDKKTVILYGRGFKKLNWNSTLDKVETYAMDIFDIVVDPLTNPIDIETARFWIHQNIFRSLRDILADERYSSESKARLKTFLSTKDGILATESNRKEMVKKQQRLKDMGVLDDKFPNFAAGDVIVNLTEHYTNVWSKSKKEFERHVVVYADDMIEMMDEKLEDLIGVKFWPLVTWGEDVETVDFWSDGPGDLVRTPNKILNVWFSQMVENRTLKNFQMHWYDATIQGYVPQIYEPGPGRMLPSPGNPKEVIMPVDISGLDDSFDAINFLTNVIEKGTSTSAIDKGQPSPGSKKKTKAEVQAMMNAAQERVLTLSLFYRRAWLEFALKWKDLMHANSRKRVMLYKTAQSGKTYPKEVMPKEWKSDSDYDCTVRSTSEQEKEKSKSLQRFQVIMAMFPGNPALVRVAQRRALDVLDLTSEELKEIEDAQKQLEEQQKRMAEQPQEKGGQPINVNVAQPQPQTQPQIQPRPQGSPVNPQALQALEEQLKQFYNA